MSHVFFKLLLIIMDTLALLLHCIEDTGSAISYTHLIFVTLCIRILSINSSLIL